jgi:hypothetical protein
MVEADKRWRYTFCRQVQARLLCPQQLGTFEEPSLEVLFCSKAGHHALHLVCSSLILSFEATCRSAINCWTRIKLAAVKLVSFSRKQELIYSV